MATKQYTITPAVPYNNHDANVVKWTLSAGDDGAPLPMPQAADRSAQILGTFGGATVIIEGANDNASADESGTRYSPLTDPFNVAISKSAAGVSGITEMTRVVRPRVSGGDGTTAIEVYILLKR